VVEEQVFDSGVIEADVERNVLSTGCGGLFVFVAFIVFVASSTGFEIPNLNAFLFPVRASEGKVEQTVSSESGIGGQPLEVEVIAVEAEEILETAAAITEVETMALHEMIFGDIAMIEPFVTLYIGDVENVVRMRAGPSLRAAIVTHLEPGTVVRGIRTVSGEMLNRDNDVWWQVEYNGEIGYIYSHLLQDKK
jgi:hypothetical protein